MSHFYQRTLPGLFIRMVVLEGMIRNYNLKNDSFPGYSLEKLCVYWEAIIVLWQNIACTQNLPPSELAPYVFAPALKSNQQIASKSKWYFPNSANGYMTESGTSLLLAFSEIYAISCKIIMTLVLSLRQTDSVMDWVLSEWCSVKCHPSQRTLWGLYIQTDIYILKRTQFHYQGQSREMWICFY